MPPLFSNLGYGPDSNCGFNGAMSWRRSFSRHFWILLLLRKMRPPSLAQLSQTFLAGSPSFPLARGSAPAPEHSLFPQQQQPQNGFGDQGHLIPGLDFPIQQRSASPPSGFGSFSLPPPPAMAAALAGNAQLWGKRLRSFRLTSVWASP